MEIGNKNIKFSVVIPVYNVEPFLPECIDSVLYQNYTGYEVILIDDGSIDNSGQICDSYSAANSRIKVIHQHNAGLSAARNTGIKNASGDYIIFLDSDDYWKSNDVLFEISERLNDIGCDVLSFDYIKVKNSSSEKSYFENISCSPSATRDFSIKYQVDSGVWIACAWNKVVRKSLFEDGGLYFREGITSEDIDWCLRLALKAETFDYLNKVVVCYRQREDSISNNRTVAKTDILLDNIEYGLELMKNASAEKVEAVKPFMGYQYGTAMYHVSEITDKTQYERLLKRLKTNRHLLYWSDNRKIKLLRMAYSIGGIRFIMILLRLREKAR